MLTRFCGCSHPSSNRQRSFKGSAPAQQLVQAGELARLVLEVLRTAPAALSVREITVQVMERRGLDPQDARTVELLRKLVSNALNRQAADLVERIQDGVQVSWQVRG